MLLRIKAVYSREEFKTADENEDSMEFRMPHSKCTKCNYLRLHNVAVLGY